MTAASLTPWEISLGVSQGQIQPTIAPPGGDWVVCLGSNAAGTWIKATDGDGVQVEQSGDLTLVNFVRATVVLVGRSDPAVGFYWWFSMLIDGVEVTGQRIPPNSSRMWIDVAANVANVVLPSTTIAFRLELRGITGTCLCEMPAVCVDSLVLDDTTVARPTLINRDPEPGHTAVRTNKTISIDLAEVGVGAIALSETRVYIDSVLASDGGVAQAGFTGPESGWSNPAADVLRVTVDPLLPFGNNEVHTIRVVSMLTGDPSNAIDESWTFDTEDLLGPVVVIAQPLGLKTISLTFDEPVVAASSRAVNDALNPASYTVTLGATTERTPAVGSTVVTGIEQVGGQFVLTLRDALTPGATYDFEVRVADAIGNIALGPSGIVQVVGYQPVIDPGRVYDYVRSMPAAIVADDDSGDLTAFLLCCQEIGELLLYETDRFPEVLDPDLAPESFIDAMLLDLGNPFEFDLSEADKRRLAKVLRRIYKQKGTDVGIVNAIRFFLGIEVTIATPYITGYLGEMTLGGSFVLSTSALADLYTFVVHVPTVPTAEQLVRINGLVDYMKRAPCHWRVVSPSSPVAPDHWVLGLSKLGTETILHV